MHKLSILLALAIFTLISCDKRGPEYPTVKPATKHYFTASYQAYDSSYTIANNTNYTSVTEHYSYNKTLPVFMDSTANYITVGADTFKWNEQYPDYSGYYSYFSSPIDNNQVVLTQDSIRLSTKRQQVSHRLTTGLCIGYRKP